MNLKLKTYFSMALVMLVLTGVNAQRVLTLDECLALAMENNIELKRVKNNHLIAKANAFQAWMNYLPTLNARANYDFFTGNFFDTNAAKQVSETTNSSNPSIGSGLTLFNGFSNHFSLLANKASLKSADSRVEQQRQVVKSNVLANYLSVVRDMEAIKISKATVKLLESQLEREVKRESIGVGNMEQVFNFKSNLADARLNLVNAQNTARRNRLVLLQSLQINPNENVTVSSFEFSGDSFLTEIEPFNAVINEILDISPSLKITKLNAISAKYSYGNTWSQMLPTLTASAAIGSNFSSNGAFNSKVGVFDPGASFKDQIFDFNKFNYFNFQLNIPIFNNWRSRNSMQVAKLNMHNSELDLERSKQTITNTVERVYSDLISAQETYKAALENLSELKKSYEFAKTRHENGSTDLFTLRESLNNKNRAELELVNAKYSIVFRKKILDVYKGTF